jgi:hypothetical protein
MGSVFVSSVIDRDFKSRSGQNQDYTIGICCLSVEHASPRNVRKDWLDRNKNIASV